MTDTKLGNTLRSVVRRYGFEQVARSLLEIELDERCFPSSSQDEAPSNDKVAKRPIKRNARVTATDFVSALKLPPEKKRTIAELAKRFEDKSFLPTFSDIANFCRMYGIDEPASRTRASAIPRVYKFIATMDTDKIRNMLDDGMFSGPSKLGPISDAIRNNGRSRVGFERTRDLNEHQSPPLTKDD